MDPELKKALDGLNMTMSEAIAGQQKALAEFQSAHADATKKHDAVVDEKMDKLQKELDKFEPLSAAMKKIEDREAAAEAEAKERGEQLDRIEARLNRPGALTEEAVAKQNAKRAAFLEFLRVGADNLSAERKNILTLGDDTGGGYLATPEYSHDIIKGVIEFSPMRELVAVGTTSSKSVQMPRRTGVFAARWTGEIEPRQETQGLAYGLHEVQVNELTAEVYISLANLEDSDFNLEQELNGEFAEQFGVAEGAAIVSGTGRVKPEGFLTAEGTVSVNSLGATSITSDGIIDLKHSIKTAYARNASFVLNRSSLRDVRKLKNSTGDYIWVPGLAVGKPNTIDGDPYTEVPDMPSAGAGLKPIAFGDWKRGYKLIDRVAMSILRDQFTRASVGQVKFVARRRLAGAVTLPEAIAVMTCAATANP